MTRQIDRISNVEMKLYRMAHDNILFLQINVLSDFGGENHSFVG